MERRQIVAAVGAGAFAAGAATLLASLQPALEAYQLLLSTLGICGVTGGLTTWAVLWATTEPKAASSPAPSPEPKPAVILMNSEPAPPKLIPRIPVHEPQGVPNMSLKVAIKVVAESDWAAHHQADEAAIAREIADKLYLKSLSAWGREDPDARLEFIMPPRWRDLRLDPKTGQAKTANVFAPVIHDIQFDGSWVYSTWPATHQPV